MYHINATYYKTSNQKKRIVQKITFKQGSLSLVIPTDSEAQLAKLAKNGQITSVGTSRYNQANQTISLNTKSVGNFVRMMVAE